MTWQSTRTIKLSLNKRGKNDYVEETKENAKEYIQFEWQYLKDKDKEEIFDILFLEDSVTGNGSGSYTFSTYQAQQNISELIFDDDFIDELEGNFGGNLGDLLKRGAEAVDVTARCLALYYVDIDEILEELKED